ncbi:MAG: hypothetical protein HY033_04680 [Ignavibacteriae bacterium]|nr:hypothetical protein [Ignavibacteria bacterium]MBI3364184.1 hypothetical protein [Ignavibacteriota bacterium]
MDRKRLYSQILSTTPLLVVICMLGLSGCKNEPPSQPPPDEKWHTFTTANSPISDDHIYNISVGLDGKVWFATRNGALYYDRTYWGAIHDSLRTINYTTFGADTSYIVYSIAHAKDRAIWFALAGGGIVRYAPSSDRSVWKRFTSSNGAFDYPLSLAADRSAESQYGEIWVTAASGVNQFVQSTNEGGVWHQYRKGDDISTLPTNQVWVVAIKPDDNTVWFGTQTGGPAMTEYSVGGSLNWNAYPFPTSLDSKINSIAFDLSNTIWLGKDNGAATYNRTDGSWKEYSHQSTDGNLPGGRVNAVLTNYLKLRWFGTDSGLVRLSDTVWTRFTKAAPANLPSDTVTALQYDTRNNLWIGTPNGITVYNEDGIRF